MTCSAPAEVATAVIALITGAGLVLFAWMARERDLRRQMRKKPDLAPFDSNPEGDDPATFTGWGKVTFRRLPTEAPKLPNSGYPLTHEEVEALNEDVRRYCRADDLSAEGLKRRHPRPMQHVRWASPNNLPRTDTGD